MTNEFHAITGMQNCFQRHCDLLLVVHGRAVVGVDGGAEQSAKEKGMGAGATQNKEGKRFGISNYLLAGTGAKEIISFIVRSILPIYPSVYSHIHTYLHTHQSFLIFLFVFQ